MYEASKPVWAWILHVLWLKHIVSSAMGCWCQVIEGAQEQWQESVMFGILHSLADNNSKIHHSLLKLHSLFAALLCWGHIFSALVWEKNLKPQRPEVPWETLLHLFYWIDRMLNWPLMTYHYTSRSVFLLVVDDKQLRDPQLVKVQRIKVYRAFSSKRDTKSQGSLQKRNNEDKASGV